MSKSPEDLTLEEIKEQLAIYQRLYYHKKKQETQYLEAKKKSAEQRVKREILNKILEESDRGIKLENLNLEELDNRKKKKGRKIIPAEKAVLLKTVPVEEEDKEEEKEVEEKKLTKKPKTKKAKKEQEQ